MSNRNLPRMSTLLCAGPSGAKGANGPGIRRERRLTGESPSRARFIRHWSNRSAPVGQRPSRAPEEKVCRRLDLEWRAAGDSSGRARGEDESAPPHLASEELVPPPVKLGVPQHPHVKGWKTGRVSHGSEAHSFRLAGVSACIQSVTKTLPSRSTTSARRSGHSFVSPMNALSRPGTLSYPPCGPTTMRPVLGS